MHSRNPNRARRALTWASLAMTSCITAPDRDLSLSATDAAEPPPADAAAGGSGGPDATRGGAGGEGAGGTGGAGGRPAVDAGPVNGDAALLTPDGFVVATDAIVSRPDAFVAAPDAAGLSLDAFVGPPPTPDAAVVLPPTPDAFVGPPTPDAFVTPPPTPDASAGDAAVPDAVVAVVDAAAPDAAVAVVDAAVADAALPDAGVQCGALGCLTVSSGEIDLRAQVARILGHLAACGPRDEPPGDVSIRLDEARYTVPADAFRREGNTWVGCVGSECDVPVAVPLARAVFRPIPGASTRTVMINGLATREASASDDLFSTVSMAYSALALAAAINDSSCMSGVQAVAGPAYMEGEAPPVGGRLAGLDAVILNNVTISNIDVVPGDADHAFVDAVNAVSAVTGVLAELKSSGRLALWAPDGRNIHIQIPNDAIGTALGFPRYQLGTMADVYIFSLAPFWLGQNEWYPPQFVPLTASAGQETAQLDPWEASLDRLPYEPADWLINGTISRRPTAADDPLSAWAPALSARARAAAINESTGLHGVHATPTAATIPMTPFNEMLDMRLGGPQSLLNGVPLPEFDFLTGDATGTFEAAIESISDATGVHIRFVGTQPFLVAPDGRNIEVDMPYVSTRHGFGQVELSAVAPFTVTAYNQFWTAPAHHSAPDHAIDFAPNVDFTIDPATAGYALTVRDTAMACITTADGVDYDLGWHGQTQTGFIPTQVVGPGRYAGTWLLCE